MLAPCSSAGVPAARMLEGPTAVLQAMATAMDSPARAVRWTCVPLPLIVAPAAGHAAPTSSALPGHAPSWLVTQVRAAWVTGRRQWRCSCRDALATTKTSNGSAAGLADCDGQVANGCETNLLTSVAQCGTCINSCTVANGTPGCVAGACTVQACNEGKGGWLGCFGVEPWEAV